MAEENQENKLPQDQPSGSSIPFLIPRSYTHDTGTKTKWPELEGLTAEAVEKKIKEEMPNANTQVIPHDAVVTCDYRPDRVRLFVDASGKVVRTPSRG